MNDQDEIIGLVTIPDLTGYTPEWLNYAVGTTLQKKFDVVLVGPETTTSRISESLPIVTYFNRSREGLLGSLLLPFLTFFSVLKFQREKSPKILASLGNTYINGLCCAIVGKLTDTTSVVPIQSDLYNIWRYHSTPAGRAAAFFKYNVFGHLAVLLADHVLVLGPIMEQKLRDRGIPANKCVVVPQPINVPSTSSPELDTDVYESLSIDRDEKIVLFIGQLKKFKGPERLLDTIQYVLARSESIHFVLIGSGGSHHDGSGGSYHDQFTTIFGDTDRVHILGWIDHEEMPAYYRSADLLLQTSNTEGLPNVVLESLYHGLPVVATDSGSEVPVYVSNIGETPAELGGMILNHDRIVTLDKLPRAAKPEPNRQLYLNIFTNFINE
jgi:glycosyltransferase involved in cell wall biosynthesis